MKKTSLILIALAVVFIAGVVYFTTRTDTKKTVENVQEQSAIFSDSELGLEFVYPTGYSLEEATLVDENAGLVQTLTLIKETEKVNVPVGGEGAPVITISVFNNTRKQFSQTWADEHMQYSNINLKLGDVQETVVGGANAIRYMADGLYASENVVVAHGENVYVITGQFLDENSDIRNDYQSLVESIRFIPKAGQE